MKKKIFLWLLLLLTGFAAGWFFSTQKSSQQENTPQASMIEIRQGGFEFINPLLECESNNGLGDEKFLPFKKDIESKIISLLDNKTATHISVYYRDLSNGPWLGFNEGENFAPSSLLKVPVLFAYLKIAENNPPILRKEFEFKQEYSSAEKNIKAELRLADGNFYTVNELLHRMIQFSDNDSFHLLVENINYSKIKQVHNDLGIPLPKEDTGWDYVNIKSYASLFRVLYNSSYLNRPMSELALKILSGTDFDNGLTARLPDELVVSHKFGIRDVNEQDEKQLHDCGIIYLPDNHYLLCIMTKGKKIEDLYKSISEISKLVYDRKLPY